MRAWFLERSPHLGRLALVLAVAATPVAILPASLDFFNLIKMTLVMMLGLAALWFWSVWCLERRRWTPRFSLGFWAAIFAGAYGVATIFSQDQLLSVFGLYRRYGGLIPILLYVSIMLVLVGLYWETPDSLRKIPLAVAAAAVPVAAYTLLQAAGLDPVEWSSGGGVKAKFPGSTLGNSNFVGGYLAITLPFIAYLSFSLTSRPARFASGALFAACAAGMWFTGSRGGLMAAAGGLIGMALFFRDRLARWMKTALLITVASGVILAVLVVWYPGLDRPPGPLGQMEVFRTDTFRLRALYWTAAWRNFLAHPLVGTGPDTFLEKYPAFRPFKDAEVPGREVPDKPHNIFLEHASGTGILGAGAYLILVTLALRYAFMRAKTADFSQRVLLSAFVGGLIAYLVQGFFSIDVPALALMGWVALGGIAVLSDPRILQERADRLAALARKKPPKIRVGDKGKAPKAGASDAAAAASSGWPRRLRATQFGGGFLILAVMAAGFQPLAADVKAKTAMSRKTSLPNSLKLLMQADELYPVGSNYQALAVRRVAQQARAAPEQETQRVYPLADGWLMRARERRPGSLFSTISLARVNGLWAEEQNPERYPVADHWWKRVVALEPSDWRHQYNYGAFLGNWALKTQDREVGRRAVKVLERAVALRSESPETWVILGKAYVLTGDLGKARHSFVRALQVNPEYPPARRWLSNVRGPSTPREGSRTQPD